VVYIPTHLYPRHERRRHLQMTDKIILFTAKWCNPCNVVKPVVLELVKEYGLVYEEVDVDVDGRLAVEYGVISVPCLVFMKGGEVVDMLHGVKPKSFYRQVIENKLGSKS